jgi:hypothetical protein
MDVSATRTIRLEKELDDALQTIAKKEKMTVNSIVSKMVRRYVEWDRHAEKFDTMEIGPAVLTELMERNTVDEARELGRRSTRDVIRPWMEYIFVSITFDNAIEFLRRFSKYTHRFHFEDSVDGREHAILIRHPLGLKWSAYYGGALSEIFEDALGIKIKLTIGPETCMAKFELPAITEQDRF